MCSSINHNATETFERPSDNPFANQRFSASLPSGHDFRLEPIRLQNSNINQQ